MENTEEKVENTAGKNKKSSKIVAGIVIVLMLVVLMVALLLSNCSTTKVVKGLGAQVGKLTETVAGIDKKVDDIKTVVDSNQVLLQAATYYAMKTAKDTDTLKIRVIQCQKAIAKPIAKPKIVYRDRPVKNQVVEKQTVKQQDVGRQTVQQQEVVEASVQQASVQQSSTGGTGSVAAGTFQSNVDNVGTPVEFCIYFGNDKYLIWELVNNLGHSMEKVVPNQFGRIANMVLKPGESSSGIDYDGSMIKMPVVAVKAWYREIFGSEMPNDFKPYLRGNRTAWSNRPMSKSGNYYVIRF